MTDVLVVLGLVLVSLGIVVYLIRQRRKNRCVGCPYANGCAKTSCKEKQK